MGQVDICSLHHLSCVPANHKFQRFSVLFRTRICIYHLHFISPIVPFSHVFLKHMLRLVRDRSCVEKGVEIQSLIHLAMTT
jgi:hypothetical protein